MKNIFLVLLIALLLSCSKEEKKPDGILSKQQMITLMIDINLAEAKVGNRRVGVDSSKILFRNYELALLTKHGVSDSVYLMSYNYYMKNLDDMSEISAAVVDSLSLRERMFAREKDKEEGKEK